MQCDRNLYTKLRDFVVYFKKIQASLKSDKEDKIRREKAERKKKEKDAVNVDRLSQFKTVWHTVCCSLSVHL